jgi:hypothetical protein
MREYKFRAVTREGNIITNIGIIEFFTDRTIIVNQEIPVKELLLYTGLQDKNGKEIYEGDIVQSVNGSYGTVVYTPEELAFQFDSRKGFYHPVEGFRPPFEVIGNIYEGGRP